MKFNRLFFVLVTVVTMQASPKHITTDFIVTLVEDLRVKSSSELYPVRKILGDIVGYGYYDAKHQVTAKYDMHKRLSGFSMPDTGAFIGEEILKENKALEMIVLDNGAKVRFYRNSASKIFVFELEETSSKY